MENETEKWKIVRVIDGKQNRKIEINAKMLMEKTKTKWKID